MAEHQELGYEHLQQPETGAAQAAKRPLDSVVMVDDGDGQAQGYTMGSEDRVSGRVVFVLGNEVLACLEGGSRLGGQGFGLAKSCHGCCRRLVG